MLFGLRSPRSHHVHSMRLLTLPSPAKSNSCSCEYLDVPAKGAWDGSLRLSCRYVNKDRKITQKFIEHAEKRGIKGLFITVDAPQLGRREKVKLVCVMACERVANWCRRRICA